MSKWIYAFGKGHTEGRADLKNLLGGKGANLAEMSLIGLPVPPGFTLTTDVCTYFNQNQQEYPDNLDKEIRSYLKKVEQQTNRTFGSTENPLLLSVRSGARVSMPGMMDTILNLGLNDQTVESLANESQDQRFAYDSYRRFIQMFGDVVLGVSSDLFEEVIEDKKSIQGYHDDVELTGDDWIDIVQTFKSIIKKETGQDFPQNVYHQLQQAIDAVFYSWNNQRAKTYRRLNKIPEEWGTAVNVQAMVFGNMGDDCATGVAFTRDPSTGEKYFYGEYLINAQGEDVVAGIRTPYPLCNAQYGTSDQTMESALPKAYKELCHVKDLLENHYKDMQDIEFTVERGKLWMLQTRSGKRTAKAALKIAVDLVNENIIDKPTAITRIEPKSLDQLLHPTIDPHETKCALVTGLPASPGAASGHVVFTADEAEKLSSTGKSVILVRIETCPDDIHGMHAAKGILTSRGGMTSHAAVVARGMGKPCVCGTTQMIVDLTEKKFSIGQKTVYEGDFITINGGTGEVFDGKLKMIKPTVDGPFEKIMAWADDIRSLNIRTNAETPQDVNMALSFGAEGIGLCRTEHMFFDPERILSVREMIMAETQSQRNTALEKIEPLQTQDFYDIFSLMKSLPVTIRLLDPPLHEFLPQHAHEYEELSASCGLSIDDIKKRTQELHETNPMLGHRGCRLGMTFPEIYDMQVRSIFMAAIQIKQKLDISVMPEIMIPLVALKEEFLFFKTRIKKLACELESLHNVKLQYLIGSMIELPRCALRAGDIASESDFFSFGTNDLTQCTFGLSRDDSARFLEHYLQRKILSSDPFVSIDQEGVGELVKIGVKRAQSAHKDIKLGICGEHGGDPDSIHFFQKAGLHYVSCSPYRIPIARLAAAQAKLLDQNNSNQAHDSTAPLLKTA